MYAITCVPVLFSWQHMWPTVSLNPALVKTVNKNLEKKRQHRTRQHNKNVLLKLQKITLEIN